MLPPAYRSAHAGYVGVGRLRSVEIVRVGQDNAAFGDGRSAVAVGRPRRGRMLRRLHSRRGCSRTEFNSSAIPERCQASSPHERSDMRGRSVQPFPDIAWLMRATRWSVPPLAPPMNVKSAALTCLAKRNRRFRRQTEIRSRWQEIVLAFATLGRVSRLAKARS